jgi:HAD superfamily hydrolase (TIGR01509 family)
MNKKIEWVFFDLDGTLADSLGTMYGAYSDFLKSFGRTGNRKEFKKLNGPSLNEIVIYLKRKYGLRQSLEELLLMYQEKIEKKYRTEVRPVRGSKELLARLKGRKTKLALVTSASRELADLFIKSNELQEYFSAVISGDRVRRSKPHPDIYELACKTTKANKDRVLVVEDSLNGRKSAKAAGLKCVLVGAAGRMRLSDLASFVEGENHYKMVATGSIILKVTRRPKLATKVMGFERQIRSVWAQELKKRKIFNGKILAFTRLATTAHTSVVVEGEYVEYCAFFAQRSRPRLEMGIMPIGVSGLTLVAKGRKIYVLLSVRSKNVTQYPGYFECAPSGSLDDSCLKIDGTIDYEAQLVKELSEETGLSGINIEKVESLCLLFDSDEKTYDICCTIRLAGWKQGPKSNEYENFVLVPSSSLSIFMKQNAERIVPTSLALLSFCKEANIFAHMPK